MMETAQRRMEVSQASGSTWIFHAFISILIRAATNTVLNSGIAYNRVGGKGHGDAEGFILMEAEDDGAIADNEDDGEEEGDEEMKDFIDDGEVVVDDLAMYLRDRC